MPNPSPPSEGPIRNHRAAALLTVLLGLFLWVSLASGTATEDDRIAREAESAFKRIVALWREENYEELYEQGRFESQQVISKQDFVRLMQGSHVRLQCCWATVQNVRGLPSTLTEVYIRATLGYEYFSPMEGGPTIPSNDRWRISSIFKEDTFLLNQERGSWKIDLADILAASGYTLKRQEPLGLPDP